MRIGPFIKRCARAEDPTLVCVEFNGTWRRCTVTSKPILKKIRDEIKLASGNLLDMKHFELAMHHLRILYIRADDSKLLMDFEELGFIELVVEKDGEGIEQLPEDLRNNEEAIAEAIKNNVRKTIIDENPVNPKY